MSRLGKIYNYKIVGHKESTPRYHEAVETTHEHAISLPPKVDLSGKIPTVLDQGQLGSCQSNAIAQDLRYCHIKENLGDFLGSRLFLYYYARKVGDLPIDQDTGSSLTDVFEAVQEYHVPSESVWPYDISKFAQEPDEAAKKSAEAHKKFKYFAVSNDLVHMKTCLANGYPFEIGIVIFESFESEEAIRTGKIPMPSEGEQQLGGHALLAVGYDDATKCFKVLNSWGPDVMDHGYCYIPYDYLSNPTLGGDYHTTRLFA